MKIAHQIWFTFGLLATISASGAEDVHYLDQGWSPEQRQAYYYRHQGSEIMPYEWFLALEQPYSKQLFHESDYLASFGYLPNASNEHNPDGLPVGFTKGKGKDNREWFGMTCAACHTSQMQYQGKTVRVDGGTTIADLIGFQSKLVTATRATLEQPKKWQRFTKRLLGKKAATAEVEQLR